MKNPFYLLALLAVFGYSNGKGDSQPLVLTAKNTAMVVVDVQKGFFKGGGELPTTADDHYTRNLESSIGKFEKAGYKVLYTKDFHPADHISYGNNHDKNFQFNWNGYTEQYVYKNTTSGDCYKMKNISTTNSNTVAVLNPIVYKIGDKLYQEIGNSSDIKKINHAIEKEEKISERAPIKKKLVLLDKSHKDLLKEGWIQQRLWSKHCTENTDGAKLVGSLEGKVNNKCCVYKGKKKNIESYSGVKDELGNDLGLIRLIEGQLEAGEKSSKTIVTFGVATDVCVKATAMGLKDAGYNVIVVSDLSRGVTEQEPTATIKEMRARHIEVISSEKLDARLGLTGTK